MPPAAMNAHPDPADPSSQADTPTPKEPTQPYRPEEETTLITPGEPSPYQEDFRPGEPYPIPDEPPADDQEYLDEDPYQNGFLFPVDSDEDASGPYGYARAGQDEPIGVNGWLVVLSGVLAVIIVIGGGWIFFQTNQAAKTSQQRAVEIAQSERDVAREEVKKAQEEARQARQEADKRVAELEKEVAKASEAAERAREAARRTPTPSPSTTPSQTPTRSASPSPSRTPSTRPSATPSALIPPQEPDPNQVALGNGCTPRSNAIPDGIWYGFGYDRGGVLEFDMVCLYANGTIDNRSGTIRTIDGPFFDPQGELIGIQVNGGRIIQMWFE